MTAADGIAWLQENPLHAEWLFTGRRAVLARILDWVHTEKPGAFVVTGSAGSGKSAVMGRIVALSAPARRPVLLEHAPLEPEDPDPGMGCVDAAVHLRGMGAYELAALLAERLQLPAAASCRQLVEAVAAMPYPPVLVFDGLDEAIPEQATEIVTDLLVPLSVLASVLLATRHEEFGWRSPQSGQEAAARLGELFGRNALVADLDAEPDTRLDIERYLTRWLRCAGLADLAPRVAPVLARKAATRQGGFLYARTVVSQIARGVIDVHAPGWEG
ncbi:MAG: tetratricopeptide repeat protein, partial [Actinomycetes bacterium]